MKDTNEQSDEEVHKIRSGKVPSIGASVPVELEYSCSEHLEVFASLETFWALLFTGFYGGFLT